MEKYDHIIYKLKGLVKRSEYLTTNYGIAKSNHDKEEVENIVRAYNKIDLLFYDIEKILRDYESDQDKEEA